MRLCTGIREAELCALEVRDLRQTLDGTLALHVREGKGCVERLVPYSELEWVLAIVDKWREAAGIGKGPVFRGFYKAHRKAGPGDRTLRLGRQSVRAVDYIVGAYPVRMGGERVSVKPARLAQAVCAAAVRGGQ